MAHDLSDEMGDPPVNVRVVYADGTVQAVECAWRGPDPVDGADTWEVVTPLLVATLGMPIGMQVDRLPAYASITMAWSGD